jgi:hypothetical protein
MTLKAEMRKIRVYWHAGKPLYAIPLQIDKNGVYRIDTGLGVFVRTFAYQYNGVLWVYFLEISTLGRFLASLLVRCAWFRRVLCY